MAHDGPASSTPQWATMNSPAAHNTGLENWGNALAQLRGNRWYCVALALGIYLFQLDIGSDLIGGSPQRAWLDDQLKSLPKSVDFILIGLRHSPVADVQTRTKVDHNLRPNEMSLRNYLAA